MGSNLVSATASNLEQVSNDLNIQLLVVWKTKVYGKSYVRLT
jgi:hypothetical protein